LSEQERLNLKAGLVKKWEAINKEY